LNTLSRNPCVQTTRWSSREGQRSLFGSDVPEVLGDCSDDVRTFCDLIVSLLSYARTSNPRGQRSFELWYFKMRFPFELVLPPKGRGPDNCASPEVDTEEMGPSWMISIELQCD
jgi:hypothetical protein